MTRADELLAAMRREGEALAGLRNERGEQDPLYLAWQELDAFMSVFGLLPKDWQVTVSNPSFHLSVDTRARMAAVLGKVVEEVMDAPGHGYVDIPLAGAIAQAVIDLMVGEARQAEAASRYWAVYGEQEIARQMAEPMVMRVEPDGKVVKLSPEEIAALDKAVGHALEATVFPPLVLDPGVVGDGQAGG
jgi:hypothetical protein